MALTNQLIPGWKYRVVAGMFAGDVITIVDNKAFPDGDPQGRARQILVLNPDGEPFTIIPRVIDPTPVGAPAGELLPQPEQPDEQPLIATVVAEAPKHHTLPHVEDMDAAEVIVSHHPILDPMDERLDHLRPKVQKLTQYLDREINGMPGLQFLLTFASEPYRSKNQGRPANLMLQGNTSSGKTFAVEALSWEWAQELGYAKPMPIYTLSGSSGV